MYHYAANNPVKYTDPDGRWTISLGIYGDAAAGTGCSTTNGISIGYSKEEGWTIGIFSSTSIGAEFSVRASAGIFVSVDHQSTGVESGTSQTMSIGGSGTVSGINFGADLIVDIDNGSLNLEISSTNSFGNLDIIESKSTEKRSGKTGGGTGIIGKFGIGITPSPAEVHTRYNLTVTKAMKLDDFLNHRTGNQEQER